ncbi:MAG: ABC transporter ATP-binding protein [Bacteroidota bacterium]
MNYAIETIELTKHYGQVTAVDHLDLRIHPGEIYGFLGLNGAGKTTTIRALLGMIRPSAGSARVLEQPVGPNGRGPWERVGHLVEVAVAYPELTVRENLEAARRLHRMRDASVVIRLMEQLKLETYADRRAGTLSLGNLQRLGLARALLHEPDLLILDEPANGLDPAGVVEIRELLGSLRRERGVTILMSSHILTEVDRLATRIGIIHKGRLIEELDTHSIERLRAPRLIVKARNLRAAQSALSAAGYSAGYDDEAEELSIADARAIESPDEVAKRLVEAGTPPLSLGVKQEELEEHFLRLTGVKR